MGCAGKHTFATAVLGVKNLYHKILDFTAFQRSLSPDCYFASALYDGIIMFFVIVRNCPNSIEIRSSCVKKENSL